MTQPKDFETRAREASQSYSLRELSSYESIRQHDIVNRAFEFGTQWARTEYEAELTAARVELARAKEALEFYANPLAWCSMGNHAYADLGKVARAALAGAESESREK